ncbi:MAG: hypothetical protein WDZ41_05195 [Candidatus Babeliales bacterium]
MLKKTLLLLLSSFFILIPVYGQKAVTITPVADLLGQPMKQLDAKNISKAYQSIPICGKKGTYACPRIHQLLFNEVVTILEEKNNEVRIQLPNLFFQTNKDNTLYNTYWTLKKNLISFEALKKKDINLAHIPMPIMYDTQKNEPQKIVTLIDPYKEQKTGLSFSAGTRFIKAKQNQESIDVYALNPKIMKIITITIPQKICIEPNSLSNQQKQSLFVQLLKQWANKSTGFIPYVWGGCSFMNLCNTDSFSLQESKLYKNEVSTFFKRTDIPNPYAGFDCAGLISRATQLCGIPYFYKNTTTLGKNLTPLSPNQKLSAGDLVWLPGHVMVVGDLKKNTIIEARHYSHGYGKLHEIPVNSIFKGINNLAQLQQAFFEKKPLKRLAINQKVVQTINEFKLLRLASVWEK